MATQMQSISQDQIKTLPPSEIDPDSLAAIRNLLDTQPEVAPQPVAERQAERAARAAAPSAPGASARRHHDPITPSNPAPKAKPHPKAASDAGMIARFKASVFGYRPTPRHLIWGGLAVLVFFRPWLVVGLLLLSIFAMTVVFLILGYDGFWQRAMGMARWYAARRPSRAAELHRKLDSFAMRWDAILDRFPEGSVDGLYLPDFGDLATADARHDAALDRRLASLSEGEA